MLWYLTNPYPALEDALVAAGQHVARDEGRTQLENYPWLMEAVEALGPDRVDPLTRALRSRKWTEADLESTFYDVGAALRALRPHVLVVTPISQPGLGVSKGPVAKWRNAGGTLVGVGQDPGSLSEANRGRRTCTIRLSDCQVYVTDHEPSARSPATLRRVALWRPGDPADHVVAAVVHARRGRGYAAGSRGRPWTMASAPA